MKFEQRKLGELIVNYDRIRIPLSSRERAERQGQYPYYGATSIMDYAINRERDMRKTLKITQKSLQMIV